MTASADRLAKQFASLVGSATPTELQALTDMSVPLELQENEVLLQEGFESSSLFFVLDGLLAASVSKNGETIELGYIGPGQWIGEVSMLDPGPATATVAARSHSQLLSLSRKDFDRLIEEKSTLANTVIRSLCDVLIGRLRSTGTVIFDQDLRASDPTTKTTETKAWLIRMYRQLLDLGEGAK
jgi:CRP/FNR family cyclic AMP-dependent transcriptional regulator